MTDRVLGMILKVLSLAWWTINAKKLLENNQLTKQRDQEEELYFLKLHNKNRYCFSEQNRDYGIHYWLSIRFILRQKRN